MNFNVFILYFFYQLLTKNVLYTRLKTEDIVVKKAKSLPSQGTDNLVRETDNEQYIALDGGNCQG